MTSNQPRAVDSVIYPDLLLKLTINSTIVDGRISTAVVANFQRSRGSSAQQTIEAMPPGDDSAFTIIVPNVETTPDSAMQEVAFVIQQAVQQYLDKKNL